MMPVAQVRCPHARAEGFTLVEVLVALVIVALVLAAGLRAAGTLVMGQDALEKHLMAGWSADNRLAEIRIAHIWPEVGSNERACNQADLQLVCVDNIQATPNPSVRRVTVKVYLSTDRAAVLAQRIAFVANLPAGNPPGILRR